MNTTLGGRSFGGGGVSLPHAEAPQTNTSKATATVHPFASEDLLRRLARTVCAQRRGSAPRLPMARASLQCRTGSGEVTSGNVPTRNRRRFFAVLLCAIVLLTIEFAAHAVYFARYGAVYTRSGLVRHLATSPEHDGRRQGHEEREMVEIAQRRILHPYFGYAMDRPETMGAGGDQHPIQKRGEGRFVVAVTGGSVANQVRSVLADALRDEFASRGLAREPVVVGLAIDGFKQPQQLATIAYFLSLGAEYDAVVNIDGFNDVVLPIVDNHERGVFPWYPRSWDSFVNRRPSQMQLLGAGEIAYLRNQQRELVERTRESAFGLSATLGLIRASQLERSVGRVAEIQQTLLAERAELPFEASGPRESVDDVAQVYDRAAELWARSSILMHGLLASRDTVYVHVLQPNQYVEGTRTLTDEERRRAFDSDHPYAEVAARGYPYLFEAAGEIREAGVDYFDATHVFAEIAQPIYSDTCCHVNRRGKRIFADAVARRILDQQGAATGDTPE
ncbi:MAG: hypothetical protein QF570_00695 [Myxococcota bacterium]|nr:hypothetical protein [Myxococcota bacterium]